MELSYKHIGKKAVLVKNMMSLLKGSEVIIRQSSTEISAYHTEMIPGKVKWEYSISKAHTCGDLFINKIGYTVYVDCLELIEEEKIIVDELDIPTGL